MLITVPPNVAPLTVPPSGAGLTAKSGGTNAKRTTVGKKESRKLFPDSDSSSNDEDPLSAGMPTSVAMDTSARHAHLGGAVLEDLFDEPATEGLLIQNSRGESTSDESIGSPEAVLPPRLGLDITEDMISGTALEQLSKVIVCVHV